MSTLYPELDIEVVKLVLKPKTGGEGVAYYLTQDYWPAGTIYAGSPGCYPLLAGSPQVHRGVEGASGIKYDVAVSIYSDTHLSEHGKTFQDLFETHEVQNAYCDIRYYAKPIDEYSITDDPSAALSSIPLWGGIYASLPSPDGSIDAGDLAHLAFTYRGLWGSSGSSEAALTTHDDAVNIRQTLRVINTTYDPGAGILTLQCRDVWFKNKEISKKLDSTILDDLDPNWKGEYGAIVFGESTAFGDGIPVDAPFFESRINDLNVPEAKLFGGWAFPDHPNKALRRILVQNQFTDVNKDRWVVVELQDEDGQTPGAGESVLTPVTDPPNWPRDLTRYERSIVVTPAEDAAKILTAVRAYLKVNTLDRCADMTEGQYFYCKKNPDIFSQGDDDLTIELWVKFDSLHSGSANRIICQQGNQRKAGKLEWSLYFNTSDDKPRFGISANGSSIAVSVGWGSNLSIGVWYHIVCRHDESANTISINVDAGTTVPQSTGATQMDRREGYFTIGSRNAADASFDGQIKSFRYWSRPITDGDVLSLYNGGVPKLTDDLTDQENYNLSASVDFNDPFGVRQGASGSLDLTSDTTSAAVPRDIPYAYASNAVLTPGNKYGEISINIGPAESVESGDTYNQKAVNRKAVIDVTTPALASGTAAAYFQIDPPLVMAPGVPYMVALRMANANTNSYFALCSYDSHSGSTHYAIDKRVKTERDQPEPNWTKQVDVRLDMQLYFLGRGGEDFTTVESGEHRYSSRYLDARSVTLATGQAHKEFDNNLVFKLCTAGLIDDSAGTYTGTTNALIEKPPHIVRFTLMNEHFGLGLYSDIVDVGSIASAISALENAYPGGLKMQIVVNSETDAESFILEVCRQARMVFYKSRDGMLRLKVPTMHTAVDATFSEARHRAEFDLRAVRDDSYGQVFNEFHQFYYLDPVNQPSDVAFIRRNPNEKLANELVISPTEATSGNSYFSGLCARSQELYDRREYAQPLNFYDSPVNAQPVQNYYCARHSRLQKRVTFRVPRRNYFATLDLFSAVRTRHTGLPNADGTTLVARAHNAGSPLITYVEGTPVKLWRGGSLEGQVVDVEEQGAWMTLTFETMATFT